MKLFPSLYPRRFRHLSMCLLVQVLSSSLRLGLEDHYRSQRSACFWPVMTTRLVPVLFFSELTDDPIRGDSSRRHPESHCTGGLLFPTQEWRWFLGPRFWDHPSNKLLLGQKRVAIWQRGERARTRVHSLKKKKTNQKPTTKILTQRKIISRLITI